jgi:hypothetical protein
MTYFPQEIKDIIFDFYTTDMFNWMPFKYLFYELTPHSYVYLKRKYNEFHTIICRPKQSSFKDFVLMNGTETVAYGAYPHIYTIKYFAEKPSTMTNKVLPKCNKKSWCNKNYNFYF